MENTLKIEVDDMPDGQSYQVVNFDGEFDKAGMSAIRELLEKTVKGFAGNTLVFNFARLSFINSEAIGYLMEIRTHLSKDKKGLAIVSLRDNVADIFKTIGMEQVIPVYKDLDAFLKK